MQEFENAIESTLEAKGLAVLAACLTGSDAVDGSSTGA